MLGGRILRNIFRRIQRSQPNGIPAQGQTIVLDYPVKASPRYGYGKPPHQPILRILEAGRNEYAKRLSGFCKLKDELSHIPDDSSEESLEPCWGPQRFFSSLDAVALYGMLVEFRPKKLVEVGSGYSTKFARRAIREHALPTRITSIDPHPRAEVDQICDSVIRRPLEEVDLGVFEDLEPGEFLFIDSSHRTFTNSDVTIVFMDLLPRLRQGVLVHIHDIFWPYDYPPEWNDRYYSEQYLLGAYLLGTGTPGAKVLLPNAFIAHDRELAENCRPLLEIAGIRRTCDDPTSPYGIGGGSFWMQIGVGVRR
jgi:Methyltransferase domain